MEKWQNWAYFDSGTKMSNMSKEEVCFCNYSPVRCHCSWVIMGPVGWRLGHIRKKLGVIISLQPKWMSEHIPDLEKPTGQHWSAYQWIWLQHFPSHNSSVQSSWHWPLQPCWHPSSARRCPRPPCGVLRDDLWECQHLKHQYNSTNVKIVIIFTHRFASSCQAVAEPPETHWAACTRQSGKRPPLQEHWSTSSNLLLGAWLG